MKRSKLLKHLKNQGCQLVREGGKHSWWGNSNSGKRTAIPRHTEIPDLLCKKICKDLDIETIG